ncbi:hypothetical protein [Sagittula sp. S175]|uniref:hypothetical protein n=1 Tax=Sagittula sp. S175 TaxID=3415129 RepID=UPI003C7E8085
MSDTLEIEVDDFPGGVAVYEYDAEFQPEERDIGVAAGWEISGEIISTRIGALHLTRDQLVQAMTWDKYEGEKEVSKLEDRARDMAEEAANDAAEAAHDDRAEYLYARHDEARWAAQ